jgi:hypothetical protein
VRLVAYAVVTHSTARRSCPYLVGWWRREVHRAVASAQPPHMYPNRLKAMCVGSRQQAGRSLKNADTHTRINYSDRNQPPDSKCTPKRPCRTPVQLPWPTPLLAVLDSRHIPQSSLWKCAGPLRKHSRPAKKKTVSGSPLQALLLLLLQAQHSTRQCLRTCAM